MPSFILGREPDLRAKFDAFQYQTEAVQAIRDLEYGAIFHEQGLGKTKIALDIVLYWLEKRLVDTALLVLKKALVENWRREIKAHTYLSPLVLGTDRRHNFYVLNSPARMVLTHYEAVRAEKKRLLLFLKSRSVGVILDESTKIKNPYSELAQAFFQLAPLFVRRVIMTGTPVANRPYDIWAQIFFLDQGGSLGADFDAFKRELDLDSAVARVARAQVRLENAMLRVNESIFKFSVRESKKSSYIQLPEKIVNVIRTDWEPRQHDLYLQVRDDI
jgi:SNF2 family DNA or RNA helicase